MATSNRFATSRLRVEVAALKFEAPEGDSWTVSRVEPKLLKRAHEIFLDTIHDNTFIFIRVDLQGNAESVDIHLSEWW